MPTCKGRNEDCAIVFANANNKLPREKKPGHLPQRKSTAEINNGWWLEGADTNDEEYS